MIRGGKGWRVLFYLDIVYKKVSLNDPVLILSPQDRSPFPSYYILQ